MVIQLQPIATDDERELQVDEMQALEDEQMQLDQDPQVPGNIETSVADNNRRRQMPDSSVQDPDYELPNSTCSRTELATTPIAPPVTRTCARLQAAGEPSCVRANMTRKVEAVMCVIRMCGNIQIIMINFRILFQI